MSRANIFISYSHRDRHWQELLVTHLGILEREGRVELWHDQRLVPGEDFARRLDEQMRTARIAVLLLSADFLTSVFVREQEVPTLLLRHAAAGMLIYPLLIRDCAWQEVPWLANLQLRPPDARPLASQSGRRDQILADVAREIAHLSIRGPTDPDSTPQNVEGDATFTRVGMHVTEWPDGANLVETAISCSHRERASGLAELAAGRMDSLKFADVTGRDFQVALHEALNNAFEHGCGEGGLITVRLEITQGYASFTVINGDGSTFDLEGALQDASRKLVENPESRRGRGLMLMRDLCDELSSVEARRGVKGVFEQEPASYLVTHVESIAVATLVEGIRNLSFQRRTLELVAAESERDILLDFCRWDTGGSQIYTVVLDARSVLARSKRRVAALLYPTTGRYHSPIKTISDLIVYDVHTAAAKLGRPDLALRVFDAVLKANAGHNVKVL